MKPNLPIEAAVVGLWRRLRGRPRQGVQLPRASTHLGTSYGGYAVLLELLNADSVVYSFGIGEDLSFDLALLERIGCTVHAFDPTPRSLAWVRGQALRPELKVHGVGLAAHDGVASFAPPKNPNHVSHSVLSGASGSADRVEMPVKRLRTLMAELGHGRLDLLKMDIEGAEYGVLDELVASDVRPTQLLLEFHHQLKGVPVARTELALTKLHDAGYRIFDVQPTGREFSLLHT